MNIMEPDKRLTLFHHENSSYREQLLKLASLALQMSEIELSNPEMHAISSSILEKASEDLVAQCTRDPASRFKPMECHLSIHSAFFAVLCYRVAHALISSKDAPMPYVVAAMKLGFVARSLTGIDIHPEARLGERFVIDHGYGTVIGQTVEIGNDAYLLNGIILGGRSIGDAPDGKRHPTIGHRVQIAANAKVLGPVHIGDDVIIGSDVIITEDVPAQRHVYVRRERLNVRNRTEIMFDVGRA